MTATLLIVSAATLAAASGFYLAWLLRYESSARKAGVIATTAACLVLAAASVVELTAAPEVAALGGGPRILLLLVLGVVGIFLLSRLGLDLPLAGPTVAPLAFAIVLALAVKASRGDLPSGSGSLGAVTVVHIGATLLGFMLFVPAYVLSVLFLDQEYHLKNKTPGPKLPSLLRLEQLSWRLVHVGFPIFSVGILLGVVWQELRGASSALRPEHLLAAGGWLVYAVVLALRLKTGWRGRRAALALMAAFVMTLSAALLYVMR